MRWICWPIVALNVPDRTECARTRRARRRLFLPFFAFSLCLSGEHIQCSRCVVPYRFVECILYIPDLDLSETREILQLVGGCARYVCKALQCAKVTAGRGDRTLSRTPNDVRNVSTSVLLTLLMLVSVERRIES